MEGLEIHVRANLAEHRIRRIQQRAVLRRGRCGKRRHHTGAVLEDHRQHALRQIAEIIRKIAVHPVDHGTPGKVTVIAEGHLTHQEVARLVETEFLGKKVGVDHIAKRLGNLLAFIRPPAMREHPFRQRQSGRHQECRPVNRVKAQDILADHVKIGRPETLVPVLVSEIAVDGPTGGCQIVRQRVKPDIHHMRVVIGNRHAPRETRTAYRQVAKPAAYKTLHFIEAGCRTDEIGVCLVEFQKRFLPLRQIEEIGRLLDPFDGRPGRRLAVDNFRLGVERLVPDGIPSGVTAEGDMAALKQDRPEFLAGCTMPCLGRPDEVIIGEIHAGCQIPKILADTVGKGLRRHALVCRGFLDFLAMFVGTGEKHHLKPVEAFEAGQHITGKGRVGVADMRLVIHVVDRCCNVKTLLV